MTEAGHQAISGARDTDASDTAGERVLAPMRSQDLLVTLLGRHVHPHTSAVYSGTFLGLLAAAGVKEHAARSTLARAVDRGQLAKQRQGRRTYYRLTSTMSATLTEGERRIYRDDPVIRWWDGSWTLVTFSLPESRRADRHRLRVRLGWAGFGHLRDGLWIAPGKIDLDRVVGQLDMEGHASAFLGELLGPTSPEEVMRQVWDLGALAQRFEAFLARWSDPGPLDVDDDLVRELYLITDWRLILRDAPALPAGLLPQTWPAQQAKERFTELHRRYARGADRRFAEVVERIDDRDG